MQATGSESRLWEKIETGADSKLRLLVKSIEICKAWNHTDDDHKHQGEHGSPQKSGNDSGVMRCQSPDYPAESSRRVAQP